MKKQSLKDLLEIKGLSETKVDKMMEAARKLDVGSGWMTGSAFLEQVTIPIKFILSLHQ